MPLLVRMCVNLLKVIVILCVRLRVCVRKYAAAGVWRDGPDGEGGGGAGAGRRTLRHGRRQESRKGHHHA